ncbi:TetR/AcrR family transcriptional regulator [Demequina sp. B12]|uniref:TetR/AcrR family transcriptional regulator n=1 Tax=Demequina sp. B12 TaxID=2992757 RepID=UPI00237ACAD6|nr:TetR/AcrR family transcriptional regulator [Demequina sp. B12]MDE0572233.1 TetR/AcrR family transcriptional regulator [Demequina sp. B12]
MSAEETSRLSAPERREQILAAAAIVFGERGYAGGTTDAIARQAGVSQAYVVRMFGSKEKLFRASALRAADKVGHAFRDTIATFNGDEDAEQKTLALAAAYTSLVADRGILLTLLHLFALGHDDTLGPLARECFLDTYRIARDEAGLTPEEANAFFARGMLTTVMLAMRLPDDAANPYASELMSCTFGELTTDLITLSQGQVPIDTSGR